MKKLIITCAALLSLMVAPQMAQANESLAAFIKKLDAMNSMEADFVQRTRDKQQKVLQELKGHLMVAKPGKLRWETLPPYAQEVVADGETVFIYDEDLEQVTIRTMEQRIQETPALLLSGKSSEIEKNFDIQLTTKGKTQSFLLTPKDSSQLFEKIAFQYLADTLESMKIYDATGQITEIIFSKIQLNKSYEAFTFVFEIPEGVDIIDARD